MGLFSKQGKLNECLKCGNDVVDEFFVEDLHMCRACVIEATSFMEASFFPGMSRAQEKANAEQSADGKLVYLTSMLDYIYEYKIKYEDNGIKMLEQDSVDIIEQIVDHISHARDD